MAEKLDVTVVIAVRNEEANIRKCLRSIDPAKQVLVIDSCSSDRTADIAKEEFNATVLQFEYQGGYPRKRQWTLDTHNFETRWVLMLDADEEIPAALWREIESAIEGGLHDAWLIQKQFHFLGRSFRFGGFSHRAVLLFKRDLGRFEETLVEDSSGTDMEVHERIIVDGTTGTLQTPLIHEDFKGLQAYLQRHNAYSTWEARLRFQFLNRGGYDGNAIKPDLFGDSQQRRRWLKHLVIRLPFEPWIWFFYHYVLHLGFLEGRPGLIAAQLRANHMREVRAKLFELQQYSREESNR